MKFSRRLLPRLFLLLTGLMVVSALSWATLFVFSEQAPRARNFAQVLTSIVNLTRSAVVAASPQRRGELLLELTRREGVRIYAAEDDEAAIATEPNDPFLRDVLNNLQLQLGPETRLVTERYGSPGIYVLVDIEGDQYWIGLPREKIDRSRSLQWLGWGILAALAALLTATLFVSRITRPLKRLADGAREVGEGRQPAPLPEDGPEEVAEVAKAFNQMTTDLDRLDQDRALILAGISHDLRTPLTRLRMGIEMSAADKATLDGMVADVEEMDRTIGQFLDFARKEETIKFQLTDLPTLLEDIAEQYRRRGANLILDLPAVSSLLLNPAMLRRAIGNLIDNAIHHAALDGRSAIELALLENASSTFIEIRDRGPGIPPSEADRLLRPFTRMDSARSNTTGTGLGLAIVDRIVRQHGGRVELVQRIGGGLIARIALPHR